MRKSLTTPLKKRPLNKCNKRNISWNNQEPFPPAHVATQISQAADRHSVLQGRMRPNPFGCMLNIPTLGWARSETPASFYFRGHSRINTCYKLNGVDLWPALNKSNYLCLLSRTNWTKWDQNQASLLCFYSDFLSPHVILEPVMKLKRRINAAKEQHCRWGVHRRRSYNLNHSCCNNQTFLLIYLSTIHHLQHYQYVYLNPAWRSHA